MPPQLAVSSVRMRERELAPIAVGYLFDKSEYQDAKSHLMPVS
jgi:hypothetical protein